MSAAKPWRSRQPRRRVAPVCTLAVYRAVKAFAAGLAAKGSPPVVPFSSPTLTLLLGLPLGSWVEVAAIVNGLGLTFQPHIGDAFMAAMGSQADARPLAKVLPFRRRAG